MKPTVGRIVHYIDKNSAHRAAIVTVAGRESLNLTVFDPRGMTYGVEYCVESSGGESNTWHWPERDEA